MAPGGPAPEAPLYSSSQSPDCVRPPGAPPQRARLPEAVEPLSREASLLHNANNQLSQDRELGTDSWSVTSTVRMWLKEAPREQVVLNKPRDCARVVASLACPQPCSPQRPDGGGTSRLDVSPSRQEATCGEQGCSQLSSPGLFT